MKNSGRMSFAAIWIIFVFMGLYLSKISKIQIVGLADEWKTGDWLINYADGFVRRGLLGEIALFFNSLWGCDLLWTVVNVKILLYTVIVVFFLLLSLRMKIGAVDLVLVLAPWGFMFDLNDPQSTGRKEIVLLAVFIFYVYLQTFHDHRKDTAFYRRWEFWFMIAIFPFLTLVHEGLTFFFHFFLLHLVFKKKVLSKNDLISFLIPYIASIFMLILIYLYFKGDAHTANSICLELQSRGVDASVCAGAISSLGSYEFQITTDYAKAFVLPILGTMVFLMCYGVWVFPENFRRCFLMLSLVSLLPTLPLYIMAADWGRWIHIWGVLMFVSIYSNKPFKKLNLSGWSLSLKMFAIVVTSFYLFSWKIPHMLWKTDLSNVRFYYPQDLCGWMKALL